MNAIELIDSFSEFKELKNIDRVTMMRIVEDVFRSTLKRKYGSDENVDVIINPDKGDLEIWLNREIVPDKDFEDAGLSIEEMVRHFIMTYRLYTLREKHSETKIIDIAVFDGKSPERSSKFYKFSNTKNQSVDKVTQDVLKLLEDQNLSESEKGEVVLKILRKIMKFSNEKDEKLA